MSQNLKPDQITVSDGHRIWTGEEILRLFEFDPQVCTISLEEFGVVITESGKPKLILAYAVEIKCQ